MSINKIIFLSTLIIVLSCGRNGVPLYDSITTSGQGGNGNSGPGGRGSGSGGGSDNDNNPDRLSERDLGLYWDDDKNIFREIKNSNNYDKVYTNGKEDAKKIINTLIKVIKDLKKGIKDTNQLTKKGELAATYLIRNPEMEQDSIKALLDLGINTDEPNLNNIANISQLYLEYFSKKVKNITKKEVILLAQAGFGEKKLYIKISKHKIKFLKYLKNNKKIIRKDHFKIINKFKKEHLKLIQDKNLEFETKEDQKIVKIMCSNKNVIKNKEDAKLVLKYKKDSYTLDTVSKTQLKFLKYLDSKNLDDPKGELVDEYIDLDTKELNSIISSKLPLFQSHRLMSKIIENKNKLTENEIKILKQAESKTEKSKRGNILDHYSKLKEFIKDGSYEYKTPYQELLPKISKLYKYYSIKSYQAKFIDLGINSREDITTLSNNGIPFDHPYLKQENKEYFHHFCVLVDKFKSGKKAHELVDYVKDLNPDDYRYMSKEKLDILIAIKDSFDKQKAKQIINHLFKRIKNIHHFTISLNLNKKNLSDIYNFSVKHPDLDYMNLESYTYSGFRPNDKLSTYGDYNKLIKNALPRHDDNIPKKQHYDELIKLGVKLADINYSRDRYEEYFEKQYSTIMPRFSRSEITKIINKMKTKPSDVSNKDWIKSLYRC